MDEVWCYKPAGDDISFAFTDNTLTVSMSSERHRGQTKYSVSINGTMEGEHVAVYKYKGAAVKLFFKIPISHS